MRRKPWLWLLAGPNGAGKSTHAPVLRARVEEIVGPDEVAYRVARDAPPKCRVSRRPNRAAPKERVAPGASKLRIETTISGTVIYRS